MFFATRAARVAGSLGCAKWKMYARCRPGVSAAKAALNLAFAASLGLELLGHLEVLGLLERHLQPRALDLDRLAQVGLQRLLEPGHVLDAREPDLPGRLHVLGLLNEDALGVLEQRALVKQDGAVLLEAVDERDVLAVERVARLAPLQIFGQPAVEEDLAELLELRAPLVLPLQKRIHLGVHRRSPASGGVPVPVLQHHW